MPDNFGRMTSDEAPQSLKDFCFPKQEQKEESIYKHTPGPGDTTMKTEQIQLQPLYGVPVVCACEGDRYALLTQRDDPKAEPVSWRIGWDFAQAPAAYYLVEDCSHQYDGLYGTQVWRIEDGRVTHSAWFEGCGSVERGLKELIDLYSLSESVEDLTVVQGRDADDCGRLYYLAF